MLLPVRRLWEDWQEQRTAINAAGAPFDFYGYAWACLSELAYMRTVSWGVDRDVPMLLVGSSFAAVTFTLAWLVARRRHFYVRWREPLALLGAVHFSVSDVQETLRSTECYVEHHAGSTLRLLALLVIHNPAILLLLYSVYGRMPVAWSLLAQPLMALYPVLRGRGLCRRALNTPGTPSLMAELRHRLNLVFGLPMLAPLALLNLRPPTPMCDCLALNCFSMLFCVVLLPLFVLRHFDRRRRCAFIAQRRLEEEQQQRVAAAAVAEQQRQRHWLMWHHESGDHTSSSNSSGGRGRSGWDGSPGGGGSGGREPTRRQRRRRPPWGPSQGSEWEWSDSEEEWGSEEDLPESQGQRWAGWAAGGWEGGASEAELEALPQPAGTTFFHLYLCSCMAWVGSVWLASRLVAA